MELINSQGIVVRTLDFSYDALNRRIRKVVGPIEWGPDGVPANGQAPNPAWPFLPTEYYVYDGAHIALMYFDRKGPGNGGAAQLRSRLLYGPLVDQVLADESHAVTGRDNTTLGMEGLFWLLSDHQGSIRDVLNSASCVGTGHIEYTAFGRIARVTNSSGETIPLEQLGSHRFLYTGREFDYSAEFIGGGHDTEINFQYNRARYYDAAIGRWLSADPISFGGGDANLYRYVGNSSPNFTDASGLKSDGFFQDFKYCVTLYCQYFKKDNVDPLVHSSERFGDGVGVVIGDLSDGEFVAAGREAAAFAAGLISESDLPILGPGASPLKPVAGIIGDMIDEEQAAKGKDGAGFFDLQVTGWGGIVAGPLVAAESRAAAAGSRVKPPVVKPPAAKPPAPKAPKPTSPKPVSPNCFVAGTPVLVAEDEAASGTNESGATDTNEKSPTQSDTLAFAGLVLVTTLGGWHMLNRRTRRATQPEADSVDDILESNDWNDLTRPTPRRRRNHADDGSEERPARPIALHV